MRNVEIPGRKGEIERARVGGGCIPGVKAASDVELGGLFFFGLVTKMAGAFVWTPYKKGKVIYLTRNKNAKLLRKAVKEVRPDTTSDELKRYSTHSLRVWAWVLLDEAGKSPNYIKKRLQWLGDSFRMYLRDTAIIQHQHVVAWLAASQEVMDLISALPMDVIPATATSSLRAPIELPESFQRAFSS